MMQRSDSLSDLIQIDKYPVKNVLRRLLEDKTTGKNIIFATDMYYDYGYSEVDTMTEVAILGLEKKIKDYYCSL